MHPAGGCPLCRGLSRRRAVGLIGATTLLPLAGGCERIGSWLVSEDDVAELGAETWTRLRRRMPASDDQAARELVADIASRLVTAAGGDPASWELEVFADSQINAFVLPGRKIGVLQGMIDAVRSPDELAAVIGHEIGHLEAEHTQERLTAELARQWGQRLIAFMLDISEVAFAQEIAAVLGVGVEFGLIRPYSRRQELEADRLGLFMMAEADYNPSHAVSFWQRMEKAGSGRVPVLLSTHPAPGERAAALQEMVPEAIEAARR